jgi:uncharacterized repeat protein (TIGR01451 family)
MGVFAMRWRAICAAVAATGLSLVLGSSALACAAVSAPTPQFDGCLEDNGLTAPPAGQAGKDVQVCKTVRVSKVTTYTWTLTKTPDPASVKVAPGGSAPIRYTLRATATPSVQWVVDGDVVVRTGGVGDATVSNVTDVITLPDGSTQTVTLAKTPFLLQGDCDPEKVFHYRFVVTPGVAGAGNAKGTNTAKVTWTAPASGNGSFVAPVDFADGPQTNAAVYFRTATLSDAFAAPPAGVSVTVPDDPGPWKLAADDPASLSRSFTSSILNVGLACQAAVQVADTATLRPPSKAEVRNRPTGTGAPDSDTITATASVSVTSDCSGENALPPAGGPPSGGTPPGNVPPAGTPPAGTPPAETPPPVATSQTAPPTPEPGAAPTAPNPPSGTQAPPVKPQPTAGRPLCPAPTLSARVIGARRVAAGQRLTWRIQIRNSGRVIARRVVLSDRLPNGFALVSSTPRATFAGGTLRFSVPSLRPGRSAVVSLTMQVPRAATGSRVGTATLRAACGGIESARTPVTVFRIPARILPAVTG